ncbi:MAG: hypothetical protein JWO80_1108 [Bryobacterales bacterium]|nr:hypothetical protein [Bryobacterales bacterium]
MFKTTFVALAFTTLAHAAGVPQIAIFLDFENEPSVTSISEMKEEVSAILKPSGLQLDWRMLNNRKDDESFQDLVVVKFKGSCQMRNPALDSELGPSIGGVALASTQVSDGRVLPFSDVECDRIRHYISNEVVSKDEEKRESIYGRALGRVLAHELYHIFTGTQHHAHEGVARSFHTRRDLTGKEFRFSPTESNMLHQLKWRALLASEGERPSVAVDEGPALLQARQ